MKILVEDLFLKRYLKGVNPFCSLDPDLNNLNQEKQMELKG